MHATICRHEDIAGSTEEVMHAGRRLAMALSKLPGFVTYALLEAGDGVLATMSVFETQATWRRPTGSSGSGSRRTWPRCCPAGPWSSRGRSSSRRGCSGLAARVLIPDF